MRARSLVAALLLVPLAAAATCPIASTAKADAPGPANACSGTRPNAEAGVAPADANGHTVPSGFDVRIVARVPDARELAALPNGDLLVATGGTRIYIVPAADAPGSRQAGEPRVFATLDDRRAAGIAFAAPICTVFFAGNGGVWSSRYEGGDLAARSIVRIANVRTGGIPPDSDGDVHVTTSVAYTGGFVYASVGSSCNACTEIDPTRSVILRMRPNGDGVVARATRIRNGIALFVDPASGDLWVGDAGQDALPYGHPYEFIDDVSSHAGVADYGWPDCEENRHAYARGADCAKTVEPRIELPAYSTIIGATFYPTDQRGPYAFPARYRGGIFATAHGSWHTTPAGDSAAAAQVVFIPMNGDAPGRPVDWANPNAQWERFVGGFQLAGRDRNGRPTGIAVGASGSLFVSDDKNGVVYRIRPQ